MDLHLAELAILNRIQRPTVIDIYWLLFDY